MYARIPSAIIGNLIVLALNLYANAAARTGNRADLVPVADSLDIRAGPRTEGCADDARATA
jgi:hypothetical protein